MLWSDFEGFVFTTAGFCTRNRRGSREARGEAVAWSVNWNVWYVRYVFR